MFGQLGSDGGSNVSGELFMIVGHPVPAGMKSGHENVPAAVQLVDATQWWFTSEREASRRAGPSHAREDRGAP